MDFAFLDVVASINLIISLALVGAVIYLWVRVANIDKTWSKTIDEIKSKIGALIRQINSILEAEYTVDVAQQADINKLKLSSL